MTYRPLAYTGPESGTRIEFTFSGEMEDETTHNLGEFQFAGSDNKYYQDRSVTSGAFPFTLLFNNQDDLREARQILSEKVTPDNPGTLEHPDPTIGTILAVCSGFSVSQNSVKGSGIIRVSVQFFKQIPNLIGGDPSESNNPASAAATQKAIDNLNVAQAEDFEGAVTLTSGNAVATVIQNALLIVEETQDLFSDIVAKNAEINILFSNLVAEISAGADELVQNPATLARYAQNLVQLPMLAVSSVSERLNAYVQFITNILSFSETEMNEINSGTSAGKNLIATRGLAATAAISAMAYSAVTGTTFSIDDILSGEAPDVTGYLSRSDIISAIVTVQETARSTTETLSELAADFGATLFFDKYFDYSILNKKLIAAVTKNLNARIFDAAQELIYVTDRSEHVVPLCARVYKSVTLSAIQFLMSSNGIHGDRMYLFPADTEIVYYKK